MWLIEVRSSDLKSKVFWLTELQLGFIFLGLFCVILSLLLSIWFVYNVFKFSYYDLTVTEIINEYSVMSDKFATAKFRYNDILNRARSLRNLLGKIFVIYTAERYEGRNLQGRELLVIFEEIEDILKIVTSYEDKNPVSHIPSIVPIAGDSEVIASFGKASLPFYRGVFTHFGVDIASLPGEKVVAPSNGRILFVGEVKGTYPFWKRLGKVVIINHENEYITILGPIEPLDGLKGKSVKRGETIGKIGKNTFSPPGWIHYEIRRKMGNNFVPVNPLFHILDGRDLSDATYYHTMLKYPKLPRYLIYRLL